MLLLNVPFAYLVKKLPRARFIPIAYRFFAVNILLFAIVLHFADAEQTIWVGRVFFIWISIYNLFVVSIFWALIVDIFNSEQGKRLFGFIAAGATIGAIVGSGVTASLARYVPVPALLIGSVILLEVAVFAVRRLSKLSSSLSQHPSQDRVVAAASGRDYASLQIAVSWRSQRFHPAVRDHRDIPLFRTGEHREGEFRQPRRADRVLRLDRSRGECADACGAAFLHRPHRALARHRDHARASSRPDPVRLRRARFHSGGLGARHFQILRRSSDYAIARPAREVLYTVVPREDRYKASFIDTVVYRGGDQVGAWTYAGFAALGLGTSAIAVVAIVLAAIWFLNGLWLGKQQEKRAAAQADKA